MSVPPARSPGNRPTDAEKLALSELVDLDQLAALHVALATRDELDRAIRTAAQSYGCAARALGLDLAELLDLLGARLNTDRAVAGFLTLAALDTAADGDR